MLRSLRRYNKLSDVGISAYIKVLNDLRVYAGLERLMGSRIRRYLLITFLITYVVACMLIYTTFSIIKYGTVLAVGVSDLIMTLVFTAVVSTIITIICPLAWYYLRALNRGKSVEKELKYFIISEGIATSTATELINDLVSIKEWGYIFPTLSRESVKLIKLRKFMSLFDTVNHYSRWVLSRTIPKYLSDYLHSLSLGTALEWLQDKTDELISELKSVTQATIKLRITVSLTLAIILGYVPPLIMALSVLTGEDVVVKALATTLLATPIFMVLTPKLPLHARISPKYYEGRNSITLYLTAVPAIAVATLAYIFLTSNTVNYAYVISLAMIVWGCLRTYHYLICVTEATELPRVLARVSEVPLIISNPCMLVGEVLIQSRVRSFRNVGRNFKLSTAHEIVKELRLWVSKYVLYVITKAIGNGSLTRERVLKLRELVLDFVRDIKATTVTNTIIVTMSILLPYIIKSISCLTTHVTPSLSIYPLVASISFSLYASYVVFDDLLNTLLPGIALLTIYLIT